MCAQRVISTTEEEITSNGVSEEAKVNVFDDEVDEDDEEDEELAELMRKEQLEDLVGLDFRHEYAMARVNMLLQHAWRTGPQDHDSSSQALKTFLKTSNLATIVKQSGRESQVEPSDDIDWQSPWSMAIYEHFNHVFHDASHNLLPHAPVFGHYHPPKHTAFSLSWPESDTALQTQRQTKRFDKPTMLLPVYVHSNILVRIHLLSKDGTRHPNTPPGTLMAYNANVQCQLLFISAGHQVEFEVEQIAGSQSPHGKSAAVLVYGELCQEDDRAPGQIETEENRRLRAEMRSSYAMVTQMAQAQRT